MRKNPRNRMLSDCKRKVRLLERAGTCSVPLVKEGNPMAWIRSDSAENRNAQASVSVIAAGTHFEGRIVSDAAVLIEGTLEGEVQASQLHVAASGAVTGNISATEITILGSAEGDIRAEHIRLGSSARVRATILHGLMEIAHGARFAGRAMRSVAVPRALPAPEPQASAPDKKAEPKTDALELFPGVPLPGAHTTLHAEQAEPVA
jgi:cytoskeletal protein CcmA (bactofilin family)